MDEGRTEGAQQGDAPKQYVTVGEAAKLLGVHRNTVHHRIKVGRLTAHKVVEGEREIYRIERDSLGLGRTSAVVHTLDAQRTTAGEELARMIAARLDEIVRDYTEQLGDVREELGAERARRQMAEERAAALEVEVRALREPREAPETVEEAPEGAEPRPATGGAQEAAQEPQRRPWWRRVFGG
jgi:excisionase family DNA binding protein